MLFSIAGGPDLTLTEVSEAARTLEACADENANIIYGQIIDEGMKDARCASRLSPRASRWALSQRSSMDLAPRRTCSPPPEPRAPGRFSRRRSPLPRRSRRAASRTRTPSPDFLKRARPGERPTFELPWHFPSRHCRPARQRACPFNRRTSVCGHRRARSASLAVRGGVSEPPYDGLNLGDHGRRLDGRG
ncbi:MAG: hypothetical protein ACLTDR_08490 [Adlercreutzia equolifaciens]